MAETFSNDAIEKVKEPNNKRTRKEEKKEKETNEQMGDNANTLLGAHPLLSTTVHGMFYKREKKLQKHITKQISEKNIDTPIHTVYKVSPVAITTVA